MHQPTFASVEFEQKKRKTRRELFLERIDGLVPWDELEGRIEPHYPRAGRGRRPYPLAVMLRSHCVQLCYNLSDSAMEDLLYEAESVRRFCGLTLTEAIPDESTILHFRHLLERRCRSRRTEALDAVPEDRTGTRPAGTDCPRGWGRASNTDIAARLGVNGTTVGKWRQPFLQRRTDGLLDEPRPGAPRTVSDGPPRRAVGAAPRGSPRQGRPSLSPGPRAALGSS